MMDGLMTEGLRTMRIRAIEEVYEAVAAGEMSLDDFQAWLALWASIMFREMGNAPLH